MHYKTRIVLYLYIYIALLAVHTNQKLFQHERPREEIAVFREWKEALGSPVNKVDHVEGRSWFQSTGDTSYPLPQQLFALVNIADERLFKAIISNHSHVLRKRFLETRHSKYNWLLIHRYVILVANVSAGFLMIYYCVQNLICYN